jgi:hypothetical protein
MYTAVTFRGFVALIDLVPNYLLGVQKFSVKISIRRKSTQGWGIRTFRYSQYDGAITARGIFDERC